jgi:Zn-dependent protease
VHDEIQQISLWILPILIAVVFHEVAHGVVANWLGDDTAKRSGRLTLNPIAHIDPIGTLLLPLIGGIYRGGGFGWGKPVEWNPARVSRKVSMATANILVSFAGPFMNIVLALLLSVIHTILLWRGVVSFDSQISLIFQMAVGLNFVLFFFNLLPAPPLDGGHVLEGLMPYRYRAQFESYAKYGYIIVGAFVVIRPLAQIFLVPARFCSQHLYDLLYGLFGVTS